MILKTIHRFKKRKKKQRNVNRTNRPTNKQAKTKQTKQIRKQQFLLQKPKNQNNMDREHFVACMEMDL